MAMSDHRSLPDILDEALALLDQGASVEHCLSLYPEHAEDLRPLLTAAQIARRVPPPVPSATAMAQGRQRMMAALQKKQEAHARGRGVNPWKGLWVKERAPALLHGAIVAFVATLIMGAAVLLDVGPLPWRVRETAAQATLSSIEGQVMRLPAGTEAWVPVFEGDHVHVGDRVRVSDDAQADLAFADGSCSELGHGTEIEVLRMATSPEDSTANTVYQERGEVRYTVADRVLPTPQSSEDGDEDVSFIEVQTPVAVTRGLGGIFSLAVSLDGTTIVLSEEGQYAVTSGAITRIIAPGEIAAVTSERKIVSLEIDEEGRLRLTPDTPEEIAGGPAIAEEIIRALRELEGRLGGLQPEDLDSPTIGGPTDRPVTATSVTKPGVTGSPTSTSTSTSTPTATSTSTTIPTSTPTPSPTSPSSSPTPSPTSPPTTSPTPSPTTSPPTSTPQPTAPPATPEPTDTPAPPDTPTPEPPDDSPQPTPEEPSGKPEDKIPPGLEDTGGIPPGLVDKGGEPPGQQKDKDK